MDNLHSAFKTLFGNEEAQFQLFSPYRICPLGAHVDHQHGLVSGFAFNSGIDFLLSETESGKVRKRRDWMYFINVQNRMQRYNKNLEIGN